MGISEKFKSYDAGINIIRRKYNIKNKSFDNKKIIQYGEKVLNSTYSKLANLI